MRLPNDDQPKEGGINLPLGFWSMRGGGARKTKMQLEEVRTMKAYKRSPNIETIVETAPAIKYQRKATRYYFDVALGSILLTGEDTGGAYCLLDMRVAPGKGVPRHIHTREDEALFVLSGELEVSVGN